MRLIIRWIVAALCALILLYYLRIYFSERQESNLEESKIRFSPVDDPGNIEDAGRNQQLRVTEKIDQTNFDDIEVNYDVHTFYYPWYGNPTFDNGSYYHWNHNIMPGPGDTFVNPKRYEPPEDIGADFYPQLGPYSSRDPKVLQQHFQWIRESGIGTVVVSWYPPLQHTEQGRSWDDLIPDILDVAHQYHLKIAFHIEPYNGRNTENLRQHVAYIISKYGSHPAFYRYKRNTFGPSKSLFYIYDAYLIPDPEWRQLLRRDGKITVRDTSLDSHFIGLLVNDRDKAGLLSSGFDGFYTYFAANGFSYGSTWRNWKALSRSARKLGLIFIPCVGPGYIDASVRPWNKINTHARGERGEYYASAWQAAIDAKPPLIGITSFNEWHEGTQIEPAIPYSHLSRTYLNYEPMDSTAYLRMTFHWVKQFNKLSNSDTEV